MSDSLKEKVANFNTAKRAILENAGVTKEIKEQTNVLVLCAGGGNKF
jgi:PTS system lactose-specific IIC component